MSEQLVSALKTESTFRARRRLGPCHHHFSGTLGSRRLQSSLASFFDLLLLLGRAFLAAPDPRALGDRLCSYFCQAELVIFILLCILILVSFFFFFFCRSLLTASTFFPYLLRILLCNLGLITSFNFSRKVFVTTLISSN